MYLIALAALILLQDTTPDGEPVLEAASETPAEPTDAATLIALTESRWDEWNGVVGELASRSARERFAADLVYPVIARDNLEDGARSPIMQAGQDRIDALVDENTNWAAAQLEAETFIEFHDLQPRAARDLLRMARRDEAHLGAVVAALEPVALAGGHDGADFAALADRLAVSENRPQPYGTQAHCVDGTITLHEIADPDTLDTRREAIGLGALDREAAEGAECAAEGE
mgnify:FL=1|jgi:hypothetical protein